MGRGPTNVTKITKIRDIAEVTNKASDTSKTNYSIRNFMEEKNSPREG